jgi:hypothetical protein
VLNDRARLEPNLEAGIAKPLAKIGVLTIEKEALVQASELLECGPAKQHAGP